MLLLALLLLASLSDWIPARWPTSDPASLALLEGAPVNCLLLESRHWTPEFLAKARQGSVATLGVLRPTSPQEEARRAVDAKLTGVVLEGDFSIAQAAGVRSTLAGSGLAVIELPPRRGIRLDSQDQILGTGEGLWPGIEIEHGGSTLTGPTSSPWVNTNSGFLRFLRAAAAGAVWIGVSPPARSAYPAERYAQAIADAALAGARWIVDLDQDLWKRLLDGESSARAGWKSITRHLAYFEQRDWSGYRPHSHFALVEDAATGGLLSGGLLDLMSAQRTPVRVILPRQVSAARLRGARLLLNLEDRALSEEQRRAIEEFRKSGGVVLNSPVGFHLPTAPPGQVLPTRQQWTQLQKVWEIAYHAIARKNFGVRVFNTAGMLSSLMATPDGKSLLVHLLNYTDFPAESIAVQAFGTWKHARLYRPGEMVEELPLYPVSDGTGVDVPRLTTVATLRLD